MTQLISWAGTLASVHPQVWGQEQGSPLPWVLSSAERVQQKAEVEPLLTDTSEYAGMLVV